MMKVRAVVALLVFALPCLWAADPESDYRALVAPDNVKLGIGLDELQRLRPQATPYTTPGVLSMNDKVTCFGEVRRGEGESASYVYYVLDGKLRGVAKGLSKSLASGQATDEQRKAALDRKAAQIQEVRIGFSKSLTVQPVEQVVVVVGDPKNVQTQTLDLGFWKDEKTGMCTYLLDAPRYATIVWYDPEYLQKKDFFWVPEKKAELDALVAKGQASIKRAMRQVSGSDSTTVTARSGSSSTTASRPSIGEVPAGESR